MNRNELLNSPLFADQTVKVPKQKSSTSYRGFSSIDQEIEREIAMKWFTCSDKTTFSQKSFLIKVETVG